MDESEVKRIEQDAEQRAVWLNNLYICRERWKQVPPDNVWPGLKEVGCGALGCFLGHLRTWPEFQTYGGIDMTTSNDRLFGGCTVSAAHANGLAAKTGGLFATRFHDEGPGTDHDIVTRRIEKRIAELEGR